MNNLPRVRYNCLTDTMEVKTYSKYKLVLRAARAICNHYNDVMPTRTRVWTRRKNPLTTKPYTASTFPNSSPRNH